MMGVRLKMFSMIDLSDYKPVKNEISDYLKSDTEEQMIIKLIEGKYFLNREAIRILIELVKNESGKDNKY